MAVGVERGNTLTGLAAVGLAGSEDDKHGTQRVSGTRRPRGLCESLSAAPPALPLPGQGPRGRMARG